MLHNRYLIPGGEDQCSIAEAALLRDHGHEVELVEEDNRRVEQLGHARTALRTVWSHESYRQIDELLRAGGFDILHVQNFFPLWSPSVYYAASRNHVPVVQTLHNYRLMCANALLFRDQHLCQECLGRFMPWHGVLHACYRNSRTASAVVASMVGAHKLAGTWRKRVARYIAVSEFARNIYITGGLPPEKIVVKPNFIHPSPVPGGGGGGYALYVGRLSKEKGVATMLEAWESAHDPVPLKIVGEGPLAELVVTAARESHGIQYLGAKALPEVLDLMRSAEFLVFPSEWYETMGRTIMEAFAVGTPVVAAKIGPPATMVVAGETGFHFTPGSVAELREWMERSSLHLAQLRAMRSKARRAFEASYTGAANVELLLAIYSKAQEAAGAAPRS
ncbi:MAG TPA: glycosyltransferase family 4 protein [Candidatus Angelobacter sp.]|nr:glycosyltransferase family 4 protein [Candidatus Angelobacter sp.]